MSTGEDGFHVGDWGHEIVVTIKENGVAIPIDGAVSHAINLKGPKKTVKTMTSSFKTDGTDGKLKCVTETTTLDQAGVWEIQAVVTFADGSFHSQTDSFKVLGNL